MKTALIKVDPTDDLASLEDKLAWAKAPRALLLWPEGGSSLQSRLDFVRLRRAADRLGMQIAVITTHRRTRLAASEAKVPVFANRNEALRRGWRWRRVKVRKRKRRRSLAKLRAAALAAAPKPLGLAKRLAFFALGVIAFLALTAAVAPRGIVYLKPLTDTRETTFSASISPAYRTVTLGGHLPAKQAEAIVGGELEVPVSGVIPFPKSPAEGKVVFTNITLDKVKIPAGAVIRSVSHPKVEFETTRSGTLPAGAGEQLTLPVRARIPGTQGNLPADDLRVLLPPLAFRATVTNPAPTHGGTDISVPAPTKNDYRRAESTLLSQLQAKALAKIQAEHKGYLVVLPSLQPAEVLERTFSPPADSGWPSNTLSVGLRVRFRALLVSQKDLKTLAQMLLSVNSPEGLKPLPNTLNVKPQGAVEGLKPPYRWKFRASEKFSAPLNREQIAVKVLGKPRAEAAAVLQQGLPLERPPRVEVEPRWWPLLPLLPARITVVTPNGQ